MPVKERNILKRVMKKERDMNRAKLRAEHMSVLKPKQTKLFEGVK